MGQACGACCGSDEQIPQKSKHIEKQKMKMTSPGGHIWPIEGDESEPSQKEEKRNKLKKKNFREDEVSPFHEQVVMEKVSEEDETSPPKPRKLQNGPDPNILINSVTPEHQMETHSPYNEKANEQPEYQPIPKAEHQDQHYLDHSFQEDVAALNAFTAGNLELTNEKSLKVVETSDLKPRQHGKVTKSFIAPRQLNNSTSKPKRRAQGENESLNNTHQEHKSFSRISRNSKRSVHTRRVQVRMMKADMSGLLQAEDNQEAKSAIQAKSEFKTESQVVLSAAAQSQYGYLLEEDPNKQFVVEIGDEEYNDVSNVQGQGEGAGEGEDDDYYYYGSEVQDDVQEIFQIDVDLGGGKSQMINVTPEEYQAIFEEGRQDLLIEKVKEATKAKVIQGLTSQNTHVSNKSGSQNNSVVADQ